MKDEVLKLLLDHGTLVEPDAVEFILAQKDPKAFISDFLSEREALPLVLTLDDIRPAESIMSYEEEPGSEDEPDKPDDEDTAQTFLPEEDENEEEKGPEEEMPEVREEKSPKPAPKVAKSESTFRVITDITGNSTCEAKVENFARYFKDRYTNLGRILRLGQKMRSATTIQTAIRREGEVRIVGMVNDVGQTKNGHTRISLEDETGNIDVLILKNSPCQSTSIIKDEVIGIIGQVKKSRGGFKNNGDSVTIFPNEIIKPDVPVNRKIRRAAEDVEVLFMADIHIGSKHFLPDEFENFIDWLNNGDDTELIKYVVVAGDLVDGIGVYPNHEEELDISDINEQYAELARYIDRFPKHLEIILQPGNHDSVRPAEPQPALDAEFQEMFSPNVHFIGNPCFMNIAGVDILSYHGRSVDDLIGAIPRLTYQTPILAMKEMLRRRHLAPIYGGKTPIAPEDKDYLVINPVPDILVTGHVHGTDVDSYRGVTMICASAWQSQTPFQLMHNFYPDPAKAIAFNLKTGKYRILDFS